MLIAIYKTTIREARTKSWQNFCEGISGISAATKAFKALNKVIYNGIGFLKNLDGSLTESKKETVSLLLKTHFPDSVSFDPPLTSYTAPPATDKNRRALKIAGNIFNPLKTEWAINSFDPFKARGGDNIIHGHHPFSTLCGAVPEQFHDLRCS